MDENPVNYSSFFSCPPRFMILFALFTIGFFAGVFLTLVVFPPNTNELKEQEVDASEAILRMEKGFTQTGVKIAPKNTATATS